MQLAIETTGLTRDFGPVRAVNGINLRVERGTFYGFLGPNGAGKSTTIKMLTGLLAPTAGTMRILGSDVSTEAAALQVKRRVGVVPENLHLFEYLTAREFLIFTGRMYLLEPAVITKRVGELLESMNLHQEEKKLVLEFSHGMRKKLALAAALLPDPELLFLDEPFEGVDAVASRKIRDVLQRCVSRGATVFLTSHVLEIVEKLCTHVGIIVKGQVIFEDSMENLRRNGSLEDKFLETAGEPEAERTGLSWLDQTPVA